MGLVSSRRMNDVTTRNSASDGILWLVHHYDRTTVMNHAHMTTTTRENHASSPHLAYYQPPAAMTATCDCDRFLWVLACGPEA
jgi:hypothetical protein